MPGRSPAAVGNPGAAPAWAGPGYGLGLGQWVPPAERPVGLTVRYVRKTGSDSNGGTSPSDAWLTINKALTTVSAGTIIYVGAGTYREVVSVTNSGTPGAPIYLQGDVDGGWTGDAGMVCLTAYTTNDITAPSATQLITTASGKNDLVFQNILFVNGTGGICSVSTGQRHVYRDCAFLNSRAAVIVGGTPATGVPAMRLFDRCIFVSMSGDAANTQSSISIGLGIGVGGQMDNQITFSNSLFWNSATYNIRADGNSTSPQGGGLRIINNTFYGFVFTSPGSGASTIYKTTLLGNLIFTGGNAGAPSTSVMNTNGLASSHYEDYNFVVGNGGIQNFTQGGHTQQNLGAPMFHLFGVERIWNGMLRLPGEPFASNTVDRRGSSLVAQLNSLPDGRMGRADMRGVVRPLAPSVWTPGALERGANFGKEIATTFSGTAAISVTGKGSQDFQLPLDSSVATLTIYCQYDSNYVGPMPQFIVLPNEAMGVGESRIDAPTGKAGTWNQLTIALSPTAKGIVTVRVVSNDTTGAGKTIFDAFNVT